MDIITALGGIGAAFGLSASAGLNAYIPLLVVALAARFTDLINLSAPYDVLGSWPVIALLTVLLVIEMLVDKVPAVDTVNDVIQTFVRPTAGALLFAANANVITDINPLLAVMGGILLAGSVHATKGAVRPMVTMSTAGTGNWLVSLLEDVVAFFTSILALFVPLLVGLASLVALVLLGRYWLLRRGRRTATSL